MRHPEFDDTIDAIYAAALAEGDWAQALHAVAARFEALGAAVFTLEAPFAPRVQASPEIDEMGRRYAEDLWRIDSRTQRAIERGLVAAAWTRPAGAVTVCDQDLFTPEEHARDAFHETLLKPQGLGFFLSAGAAVAPDLMLVLTVQRTMKRGAFTDEDRRPLGTLTRHLDRAVRTQLRLDGARDGASSFGARLARTGVASAVVDRRGRVTRANAAFERLVGDPGAPLTLRDGVLAPRCANKAAVYETLLGLARDPAARRNEPMPTLALPRAAGSPLILELLPLPPTRIEAFDLGPLATAATALFIIDPDARSRAPLDVLRQAYRLSAEEARLAAEIAQGLSAGEAGRRLGHDPAVTGALAHTLMRKTGARSEAALVAKLAHLAAQAGG